MSREEYRTLTSATQLHWLELLGWDQKAMFFISGLCSVHHINMHTYTLSVVVIDQSKPGKTVAVTNLNNREQAKKVMYL